MNQTKPKLVVVTGLYRSGGSIVASIINRLGFSMAGIVHAPAAFNGWRVEWVDVRLAEIIFPVQQAIKAGEELSDEVRATFQARLQNHLEGRRGEIDQQIRVYDLPNVEGFGIRAPELALFLPEIEALCDVMGFEFVLVETVRDGDEVAASIERAYPPRLAALVALINQAILKARWVKPARKVVVRLDALKYAPVVTVENLVAGIQCCPEQADVLEAIGMVKRDKVPALME